MIATGFCFVDVAEVARADSGRCSQPSVTANNVDKFVYLLSLVSLPLSPPPLPSNTPHVVETHGFRRLRVEPEIAAATSVGRRGQVLPCSSAVLREGQGGIGGWGMGGAFLEDWGEVAH